jgi:hypothetical protein
MKICSRLEGQKFCPKNFVRKILSEKFCPKNFVRKILSEKFSAEVETRKRTPGRGRGVVVQLCVDVALPGIDLMRQFRSKFTD